MNSNEKNRPAAAGQLPQNPLVLLAAQAYVYGYPLVMMQETMRSNTNCAAPVHDSFYAPVNQFSHFRTFPNASFRSMVKPNCDTYYSSAWLDLTSEPLVLTAADTGGRYYLLPMLDAYTNVFASPGKRTTGTAAQTFLISGPSYTGSIPEGMHAIQAPTSMVWLFGRTQVNSPEDGVKVVYPIQEGYTLTPLSKWGTAYQPEKHSVDPGIATDAPQFVEHMDISNFFNVLNEQLAKNPPPAADRDILSKIAGVGVGSGRHFDLSAFDSDTQTALKAIPAAILKQLRERAVSGGRLENNWVINRKGIGDYGTDYAFRAIIALVGLGANLSADACYPNCQLDAAGERLDGKNKYCLHFDKGQTPPANAFWSLTVYGPDDFLVDNPIHRYSVGDRSALQYNDDGSVDIFIQQEQPDMATNWLAAPKDLFSLTMRIYWPQESFSDGSWKIPLVNRLIN